MGGAYKYNKDTQRWECITDCFGGDDWNYNGTESLATDPVEPNRVYLAAGTYSTNNGAIFASDDYGKNWTICEMPFGMGGNEVGRGCGERLQVDPNDNSILYFAQELTDFGSPQTMAQHGTRSLRSLQRADILKTDILSDLHSWHSINQALKRVRQQRQ